MLLSLCVRFKVLSFRIPFEKNAWIQGETFLNGGGSFPFWDMAQTSF